MQMAVIDEKLAELDAERKELAEYTVGSTCQVHTRYTPRYKQYLGIMMQYDPVGGTGAAVRQHTPHHYQLTCQSSSSQPAAAVVGYTSYTNVCWLP
jgi:hypothetical protein